MQHYPDCTLCQRLAHHRPRSFPPIPTHSPPPPHAAGADLVVLPEMWNCPYSNDSFPTYAEDVEAGDSPSTSMLSAAAAANRVVLVRQPGARGGCACCFGGPPLRR